MRSDATSPSLLLALDPFTIAALNAHRVRQLKELPAWTERPSPSRLHSS